MTTSTKPSTPVRSCVLCGRAASANTMLPATAVRPRVAEHIARHHPDRWTGGGHVCAACMNQERLDYVTERLREEKGALSEVEEEVAKKAGLHVVIARNVDAQFQRNVTRGQKAADLVARIGGSWGFVSGFLLLLVTWMIVNTWVIPGRAFDPYPYILLNLVLSCIAAIQAPIIMMSQNRQAERDRLESSHDYETDLKAEIEIASLHDKIDHLLHTQWERMVELQEMQIDLLTELTSRRRPS